MRDTYHPEAQCSTIQNRWRYTSTRYPDDILPLYFMSLARARRYDEQTAAALDCLPGMTTMRIEEWDGTKWQPLNNGETK